jgi:hypothetical protein
MLLAIENLTDSLPSNASLPEHMSSTAIATKPQTPSTSETRNLPAKCDEEKDDTTRLGVKDDTNPQRALLEEASLTELAGEPSESADMEVESAMAAIAAGYNVCGNERSL